MNLLLVLEYSNSILQMIVIGWFYMNYYETPKQDFKKNCLWSFVCYTVVFVLEHAIQAMPGIEWVKPILDILVIVVLLLVIYRRTVKETLIGLVWYLVAANLGVAIGVLLPEFLYGEQMLRLMEVDVTITIIDYIFLDAGFFLMLWLILARKQRLSLWAFDEKTQWELPTMILFQASVLAILPYYYVYGKKPPMFVNLILIVLFLISNLASVDIVKRLHHLRKMNATGESLKRVEQELNQENEFRMEQNRQSDELQNEILQELKTFDETNVSQLKTAYAKYTKQTYCDDVVLNQILLNYHNQCEQSNISFTCNVNGKMTRVLSATDFVKVFCNILDNAVEAVRNNPDGKRSIELNVTKNLNLVRIIERNPVSIKKAVLHKKVRGEGQKILSETIKDRDPLFETTQKNGVYELSLIFSSEDKGSNL